MSIPPEAVQAAVDAVMAQRGLKSSNSRAWAGFIVPAALEAAAPLIRADERERIAKLAEQHHAHYGCYPSIVTSTGASVMGQPIGEVARVATSALRPFADLIREEETT